MALPRIGFLGLGLMGTGMATRLLRAGFPLTVYNRNAAKAAPLAALGASIAETPRAAVTGADIAVAMLGDDVASRAVWTGPDGALPGLRAGAIAVECSTLTVGWVRELAAEAARVNVELVDAPVTGSKGAAAAGELNFLVGGNAPAVETIRPALNAMGRSVTQLGPTGSGALLKLLNNFMAGVHVAAFAEALAWLERTDLDKAKAVGVLLDGAPASPVTKVVAARMAAEDYTPNFALRWMAKDLSYALREAKEQAVTLTTASTALARFQAAVRAGFGDEDMAGLVRLIRADK